MRHCQAPGEENVAITWEMNADDRFVMAFERFAETGKEALIDLLP